jgi:diguanylate cyclase (GGDEF)-like protein
VGEPDLALSEALRLLGAQAELMSAETPQQVLAVARCVLRDVLGLDVDVELPAAKAPATSSPDGLLVPICAAGQLLGAFRLPVSVPLAPGRRLAVEHLAATTGAALRTTQRLADAERQARHDPLTGLLNRRALDAELGVEVHRARRLGYPLGVLMLDVDNFKSVNDHYGHGAGDETLRRLSAVLADRLRRTDRIARIGGEEFLVVLPGAGSEATLLVAQKLRRAVAELPPPRITLSLGAASQSSADVDPRALLQRADLALYAAKRAGRDQVRLWEGPGT